MGRNDSRTLVAFLLAAVVIGLAGCRDATDRVAMRVQTVVRGMSLASEAERVAADRACAEICRQVSALPEEARSGIVDRLAGSFLRVPFDERSYEAREACVSSYFRLVSSMSERLLDIVQDKERVWRFKAAALDRINSEIARCEGEPKGGPYGDVTRRPGAFRTRRLYLEALKAKRFEFVRRGFECGGFTSYFHVLPPHARREWIERLEGIARRRVVIWDPDNQMVELPPYRPDDTRTWLTTTPGRPREYLEEVGGGKTIRMREIPHPSKKTDDGVPTGGREERR